MLIAVLHLALHYERPPTTGSTRRNDYRAFDNNETKNYGFALAKPLKKHLKGSDT